MTRVVVTGGAGFIGSHLAEALLARGDTVVAVDNFDPFYPRAFKERNLAEVSGHAGWQLAEVDITDTAALAALLDPDTVVVHLAARAGVRPSLADPVGYARSNVEGTASVAEAMRRAGATRLVFGSSSSVYGDDTPAPFREDAPAIAAVSPYGATKRAGELMLGSMAPIFGLRVVSLRFFTVYGPRQRPDLAIRAFAERMRRGEPVTLFGDGSTARDYTYVADIVAGILAAVDLPGRMAPGQEIVNLGGDHPVRLDEMVAAVARAVGATPVIARAPMQPGDVTRTAADLGRARALLGYAPVMSFDDGLDRFARWLEEQ